MTRWDDCGVMPGDVLEPTYLAPEEVERVRAKLGSTDDPQEDYNRRIDAAYDKARDE